MPERKMNTTLLTLFTAPKPFTNPHIARIQRNAIRSWIGLGEEVDILLLGDEEGLAENAALSGVQHIREIRKNYKGTPLISSLFLTAREQSSSPLLAYVNADILLLPDFLDQAKRVMGLAQRFLLVGQRWDLDVKEELVFSEGWQERLREECSSRGRLHKPMGSDYFIYPRDCFEHIPDFAIGRAGWDNWMIYESRQRGWMTIDATGSIHVIHQDHDYSHLPDGKPHYDLPETDENVRLAGGNRTNFRLPDANYQLIQQGIRKKPLTGSRFMRELEIFPLIKIHSLKLAEIFFLVLHPVELYARIRKKLGLNR
jgi:hypothetical protein